MAKKNESDTNQFESAPDPTVTPEPDAYPAVLQRVRFIGDAPFSAYMREPLPAHATAGDTFEIAHDRALRLVRYYPDRYELVKSESQEG